MSDPRPSGDSGSTSAHRRAPVLRRWDGAAKTDRLWQPSDKDEELWVRNGDCFIHLYAKDTSERGPSFKLSFSELLHARCVPLIEAFGDDDVPRTPHSWARRQREQPGSTIDLYIPAPSNVNPQSELLFYVMARNFFAWTLRRSLVGEHLGGSLIGLLRCMNDFRSGVDENVAELIDYMDEEGYLDLEDQPTHAIAVLRLAEHFHLTRLYERAFDQSVAMDQRLLSYPEYLLLSSSTRWALRKAKNDLDEKHYQAADMLSDFLKDETSEARLGIPAEAREHLDRFRGFLVAFYAARFGEYPPQRFDPAVLQSMRDDFEALYDLLVDASWTADQDMPAIAAGGLCAVQLVREFDTKNGFSHLEHPLPQLPHVDEPSSLRRFSWIPGGDRLRSDQRSHALASLIKASNWSEAAMRNDFVQAYRKFEEALVLRPQRMDRAALLDARKVRWILLYGVYQVLRSVTRAPEPEQVVKDLGGLKSSSSLQPAESVESLPPEVEVIFRPGFSWDEVPSSPISPVSVVWGDAGGDAGKIEIKPDIDYFAMNQGSSHPPADLNSPRPKSASQATPAPGRSMSFSKALSRTSTIRKSLRKLRPQTASSTRPLKISTSAKSLYQGIMVQGYGNGTNDASVSPLDKRPGRLQRTWLPHRSGSTASHEHSNPDSAPDSNDEGLDSPGTPVTIPSPYLEPDEGAAPDETLLPPPGKKKDFERSNSKRQKVVSMIPPTLRRPLSNPQLSKLSRPVSTIFRSVDYAAAWDDLIKDSRAAQQNPPPSTQAEVAPDEGGPPQSRATVAAAAVVLPPPQPIRSQTMPFIPSSASCSSGVDVKARPGSFFDGLTRSMSVRPAAVFTELRRKSTTHELDGQGAAAAEEDGGLYTPTSVSQDWAAMNDFLDDMDEGEEDNRVTAKNGWGDYAELGGLTEV